jgi:hypothetical protein
LALIDADGLITRSMRKGFSAPEAQTDKNSTLEGVTS